MVAPTLDDGHTPGPWVWGDNYRGLYGSGGEEDEVLQYAPYDGLWLAYVNGREANARLIAAAPELLKALKVLLNETMYKNHPAQSQIAIDAIAKAEGK